MSKMTRSVYIFRQTRTHCHALSQFRNSKYAGFHWCQVRSYKLFSARQHPGLRSFQRHSRNKLRWLGVGGGGHFALYSRAHVWLCTCSRHSLGFPAHFNVFFFLLFLFFCIFKSRTATILKIKITKHAIELKSCKQM